jgi:hypothetical protein
MNFHLNTEAEKLTFEIPSVILLSDHLIAYIVVAGKPINLSAVEVTEFYYIRIRSCHLNLLCSFVSCMRGGLNMC